MITGAGCGGGSGKYRVGRRRMAMARMVVRMVVGSHRACRGKWKHIRVDGLWDGVDRATSTAIRIRQLHRDVGRERRNRNRRYRGALALRLRMLVLVLLLRLMMVMVTIVVTAVMTRRSRVPFASIGDWRWSGRGHHTGAVGWCLGHRWRHQQRGAAR